MSGRLMVSAAGLSVATVLLGAVPMASAAAKCTSIQARCAVEIGGTCDPKTGHWQYGRVHGLATGGNTQAFNDCVSRNLKRK